MPSTYTVQNTVNFSAIMTRLVPLINVGGYSNEPALSIANQILQEILAPPFAWPWNRQTLDTTSTVAGTQDYPVTVANFGWLETATLKDSGGKITVLEIATGLTEETTQARPVRIATQADPGAGTVTFRLFPAPDAAYTINLTYQAAPPLVIALTQTWAPVPDRLRYLYDQGFLARVYEMLDDGRFPISLQQFQALLVAAANGLSATQRNPFDWAKVREEREAMSIGEGAFARPSRNIGRE